MKIKRTAVLSDRIRIRNRFLIFIISFFLFQGNTFAQWLGTDLAYNYNGEGCFEVYLINYYAPGSEKLISKTESVSFFEALKGPPRTELALKMDTIEHIGNMKKLSCFKEEIGAYLKVTYSGVATLASIEGGYNLVCIKTIPGNESFVNIADHAVSTVALVCSISNTALTMNNKRTLFSDPPFFAVCPKEKASTNFRFTDAERDSLSFSFSNLFSSTSSMFPEVAPTVGLPAKDDAKPIMPMMAPPYKKLNFLSGYSAEKPFGKDALTYKKDTQLMTLSVEKPGSYLIGMSLIEKRGMQKIAEVQRVYRSGVAVIPSDFTSN